MIFLMKDLACQEAVELVTDYLEGKLSRRQRRRFESHLRACPNCRQYLEQMRQTIAALGAVEPDTLEPEVRDDLVNLFRRYHSEPPP